MKLLLNEINAFDELLSGKRAWRIYCSIPGITKALGWFKKLLTLALFFYFLTRILRINSDLWFAIVC